MYQAGDQLLAGSRLAPDEDRRVRRRDGFDQAEDSLERRAPSNDSVECRCARCIVIGEDRLLVDP